MLILRIFYIRKKVIYFLYNDDRFFLAAKMGKSINKIFFKKYWIENLKQIFITFFTEICCDKF